MDEEGLPIAEFRLAAVVDVEVMLTQQQRAVSFITPDNAKA